MNKRVTFSPQNEEPAKPAETQPRKTKLRRTHSTFKNKVMPQLLENHRRMLEHRECSIPCIFESHSKVLLLWTTVVSGAIIYNLWLPILRQSFGGVQRTYLWLWIVLDLLADVIYILDILVRTRCTYLDTGLIVSDRKRTTDHYIKTRLFLLDVLSLLPTDFLQFKIGMHPMIRFPRFLKVYRALQWRTKIRTLSKIPNAWRVVGLIHLLFLGCHWFACIYYDISVYEEFSTRWCYSPNPSLNYSLGQSYLESFYWATLALTCIGIHEAPTNAVEFIFTCLAYLFGLFVFATVVGQVGSIINSQNAARVAFEEVLDNVKNYMRLHSVRDDLQSRILRWYDYAWQKKSMNGVLDVASLEMLPEKLKTELVMDVNYETLRKIAIFKECRPEFLHDLVLKMRPILFTPGDYVCRKGEIAREMFIIADGVLEVLGPNNEVLAMMASGDMFGEIGVLRIEGQNKRTADVRAVGYTELYVLSRDDIMEALEDHPEAEMFMKDAARRRLYGSGGGPRPSRSSSASQYQGPSTSTQETRKVEIGFRTSERQSHLEANISDLISQVESTRVKNTLENFSKTWQTLLKDLVQAYEDEIKQLREELDERRS